mgnify:CR=1 FL=1
MVEQGLANLAVRTKPFLEIGRALATEFDDHIVHKVTDPVVIQSIPVFGIRPLGKHALGKALAELLAAGLK